MGKSEGHAHATCNVPGPRRPKYRLEEVGKNTCSDGYEAVASKEECKIACKEATSEAGVKTGSTAYGPKGCSVLKGNSCFWNTHAHGDSHGEIHPICENRFFSPE